MADEQPAAEYPPALLNAVRLVSNNDAMRPLLHEILEWCGVNAPARTEYREGQRSIGMRLHGLMDDADPNIYIRLCTERASAEVKRRMAEAAQASGAAT